MRFPLALSRAVTALALLVPGAAAQTTWVVDGDPGPGVDFLDIRPALATAGPFDLIDIFPGQYLPFTMSAPRRVFGRSGAVVAGHSVVRTGGSSHWTLIADLEFNSLGVENPSGTISLDGVRCTARRDALAVTGCNDVRARALVIQGSSASGGMRVRISASRVQIDDSVIRAASPAIEGDTGQTALAATNSSFVHLSVSTVVGGRGGDGLQLLNLYEP